MIEAMSLIISDWKRYTSLHKHMNGILFLAVFFHNPGMWFSVLYRLESYFLTHKSILLKAVGYILYPFYFLTTYFILDIDFSPHVKIGKGLFVSHRGIVVGGYAHAKNNLTLYGPITIGIRHYRGTAKAPSIGNNVFIYSGARLIGNITIGDNVEIGANAVVVKNVPSNVVVGGVPAKIIKRYEKR